MGLAIIGFSIFLRFALNPLTKPYMESMQRMKKYSYDLEKLKKKHAKDKLKFTQAQADFYKQKGINPGAGCLPYLLQIVVLIAFFNVFTKTISGAGEITANVNKLLYNPLKFDQSETLNTNFLYLDITKPDSFNIGSLKLPGPILFMSAFAQLISSLLISRQGGLEARVAKKTPETSDDFQVAMQKSMTYTFPIFTILIGMRFASGLALYWLVFSLLQAYQQARALEIKSLESLLKALNLVKSDANGKDK